MPMERRRFLRSAGSLVALPALPSLGWSRFAAAAAAPARPKRMIFLAMGFGVTYETWYPDQKQTGADWTLPPGLAPLAPHKNDITLVQNTYHRNSIEGHSGSTFWLTGANKFGVPGKSFHNTISVDQVAADHWGLETRFASLTFGSSDGGGGGHGGNVSWNRLGKPVAELADPVAVFHRLFSDDKTPLGKRQAELARQQSVLDTVLEQARHTARGLSREDTDKLDEYLESIRDIETRLAKEKQWLEVPKVKADPPVAEPGKGMTGEPEMRLMYDMMATAFQTDATRVIAYRQPLNSFLRSLGSTIDSHSMSHYDMGPRREASEKRDVAQSRLLAHLLGRLKHTRDADGSSLFDHTCVVLGTNIRTIHHLDNCPTLLAGGGAGIKLGQHVVMPDPKTPLCNVWLTLLQGVGVPAQSFGDSTGVIEQLRA